MLVVQHSDGFGLYYIIASWNRLNYKQVIKASRSSPASYFVHVAVIVYLLCPCGQLMASAWRDCCLTVWPCTSPLLRSVSQMALPWLFPHDHKAAGAAPQ